MRLADDRPPRPMNPVCGAGVDDGGCHAHGQIHRSAARALDSPSTRSVVELESRPDLLMLPNRLIEYGYVAVTTTSTPGCHVEVQEALRSLALRLVAELRTAVTQAPSGFGKRRDTAALRAPARVASVSCTQLLKTIPNWMTANSRKAMIGRTRANSVTDWPSWFLNEIRFIEIFRFWGLPLWFCQLSRKWVVGSSWQEP